MFSYCRLLDTNKPDVKQMTAKEKRNICPGLPEFQSHWRPMDFELFHKKCAEHKDELEVDFQKISDNGTLGILSKSTIFNRFKGSYFYLMVKQYMKLYESVKS